MRIPEARFHNAATVATVVVLALCASILPGCADGPAPRPALEAGPAAEHRVTSPVFIHETQAGGEALEEKPAVAAVDFLKEADYWVQDCLAAKRLGGRVAESFGSSLRGRRDACRRPGGE